MTDLAVEDRATSLGITTSGDRPSPVYFAPGGNTPVDVTIAVTIPDALDRLAHALEQAKELKARLVLVCDTAKRASAMAKQAKAALPLHQRVSIAKAKAEGWGVG